MVSTVFGIEPPRTNYDLCFSIAGIPVRVHPMFWLLAVILGYSEDLKQVLIWVAVVFVSILVHEMGHAFTMRRFGEQPHVLLYMMGGMAYSYSSHGRSRNTFVQIVISAAGPAAGFALAGMTVAAVYAYGGAVTLDFSGESFIPWVIHLKPSEPFNLLLYVLISDMLWVNIFWGLLNLLPLFPLDGGQIARAIFLKQDPWRGLRNSLVLSVVTGAALAIFGGLYLGSIFMAVMFGMLAYSSWQALQGGVAPRR